MNTFKYEKNKSTLCNNIIVFYKGRQNETNDCNNEDYKQ